MTEQNQKKRWIIVSAVVFAPIAAVAIWAAFEARAEDEEDRKIMIERRQEIVNRINRNLGEDSLSLRGANGEVLTLDMTGCGPNALRSLLTNDKIITDLMTAEFLEIRCKDNPAAIDVPRR